MRLSALRLMFVSFILSLIAFGDRMFDIEKIVPPVLDDVLILPVDLNSYPEKVSQWYYNELIHQQDGFVFSMGQFSIFKLPENPDRTKRKAFLEILADRIAYFEDDLLAEELVDVEFMDPDFLMVGIRRVLI